ncbi:MAG: DUF4442 domain-containing protein [Planctomycetota bacterium]
MTETWRTRLTRLKFNWYPAYRGTGGQVTYIAEDWSEIRIRLPLNRRTRNLVGTIYGGSMYGALDPMFMIMLMRLLGRDYVVWDKAASIRFRRPGRDTLYATFRIEPDELARIRSAVDAEGKIDHELLVDLKDEAGEVHASCTKLLNIRRRDYGEQR